MTAGMSDIDTWKINYELHLDPDSLADFWKDGVPQGCALALKAAVSEVERLEERAKWLGHRLVELEQDAEEQRQLKISMTAERDRLAAENEALRKDVVEARQWAEKWQQLAHELGADIQQAAVAVREASGDE